MGSEDIRKLRDETEAWDLKLEKDLELTKPQLRLLFRAEVISAIEDPDLTADQKWDVVVGSSDSIGLGDEEALEELKGWLQDRCRACLANAVGDFMQGNEELAIREMQRLELLAGFAEATDGIELNHDWEVAPSMRQKLMQMLTASLTRSQGNKPPDV